MSGLIRLSVVFGLVRTKGAQAAEESGPLFRSVPTAPSAGGNCKAGGSLRCEWMFRKKRLEAELTAARNERDGLRQRVEALENDLLGTVSERDDRIDTVNNRL